MGTSIITSVDEDDVADLISAAIPGIIAAAPKIHVRDFGGRIYLRKDQEWSTYNYRYGIATENINDGRDGEHGDLPDKKWQDLGIGFYPAGTLIKSMEFVGYNSSSSVSTIDVLLTRQGQLFDTVGYDSITEAGNTTIGMFTMNPSAGNTADMHRYFFDINFTMPEDGIIVPFYRAGNDTGSKYFSTNATLEYIKP